MASPNISFTQIPANVRKPGKYFEENTSNALSGLSAANDKVVILAQKTSAGTVASKTPTRIFSDADAALYFGQGSIAHLTAKAAIYANPNVDISVCAIDDAGGSAKAAGTIAITDTTASAAGELVVNVGDVQVAYSYASGATRQSIASGLFTALTSVSSNLPCTDSSSDSTVTFTARNGGLCGNYLSLTATASAGLTAPTIVQPTGGTTDPVLGAYDTTGTVLNAIVGGSYSLIINTLPTATALGAVKSMCDFVSGPMEQRPACQVSAATDEVGSLATISTLCGTTLNHGRTTLAFLDYTNGNILKTPAWAIAGAYGAMVAYNPDPALPYDGLVLAGVAAPEITNRFTRTQQEAMLNAGVTPLEVVPGEQVTIVRAISTYTVNSLSIPDPTLLDITTIRTLDYVRAQIRTRLALRFPRAKLSTRTPKLVRSQVLDVLYQMEQIEIVQNVKTYESGVICEVDISDPTRLDVKVPTNIVVGLHVIAGVIDLVL
jgi:phage tail sheath gpL-like